MSEKGERKGVCASPDKEHPPCFGDLQKVCPRDDSGIMQPQAACLPCGVLRACLRQALRQEGLISPSIMEKPVVSRMAHFLKRWSHQKLAHSESSSTDDGAK